MNLNSFPSNVRMEWKAIEGRLGVSIVSYEVPKAVSGWPEYMIPLDLHNATFVNLGTVTDRVRARQPGHHVWMAYIRHETRGGVKNYPLCLEITHASLDSGFVHVAHVPPGRPGYNATMLFDRDGKLVSQVSFNALCTVRLIFLDPERSDFGWDLVYPTIALQFVKPKG